MSSPVTAAHDVGDTVRHDRPHLDGVRIVLVDIEGTTSPTATVHDTLFADARAQLRTWLASHDDDPEVAAALDQARAEGGLPVGAPVVDVASVLEQWIDEDRKSTPLKTIQGRIWAEGFAAGRLRSELFADVAPVLARWRRDGVHLAVFSSGSVTVQRPWFATAEGTDGMFEEYFDTVNAGPKREPASYRRITAALADRFGGRPSEIAFLSDVPAELDAAAEAGLRTVGVARPGEPFGSADFGDHPTIATFDELTIAVAPPSAEEARAAGRALAHEAARLTALGWMRATSGNLSTVVRRDPLRLAVTASGVDKGEMSEHDVVVVDEQGDAVDVPGLPARRPTAEARLHATIAAETGAGAVIHVHALAPVVAAARWPAGVPIEGVEMVKAFGHDADTTAVVPVIANSQSMVELGSRFLDAHDPAVPAVIVARHGMYVWGDDLLRARHHVEGLEWALSFVVATHPELPDDPSSKGPTR